MSARHATSAECLPVMQRLRRAGIGSLLNYNVEVQEPEEPPGGFTAAQVAANQQAALKGGWANVEETIRAVQVCGEENARELAQTGGAGSAWIAIKLVSSLLHGITNPLDWPHRSRRSTPCVRCYPPGPSEEERPIFGAYDALSGCKSPLALSCYLCIRAPAKMMRDLCKLWGGSAFLLLPPTPISSWPLTSNTLSAYTKIRGESCLKRKSSACA
jgi:hypothetical protein